MNRLSSLLQRWFKSLENLGTGFAIIGFACAALADWFALPFLLNLGFVSLGAGIVAWGANSFQSGDMTPLRGFQIQARAQSLFSRLWAVLFMLGGLLLLGYGVLSLLNPRSPIPARYVQFFSTVQGGAVLWLIGSLIGVLFSLGMIFISDASSDNRYVRAIKSVPGRLVGVLLLLLFGAMAVTSFLTIFNPEILQSIVQSILG